MLAHLLYPDNVDQIPSDTEGHPLSAAAGHGKWCVVFPIEHGHACPGSLSTFQAIFDADDVNGTRQATRLHSWQLYR